MSRQHIHSDLAAVDNDACRQRKDEPSDPFPVGKGRRDQKK
jgi:hypothetical protein